MRLELLHDLGEAISDRFRCPYLNNKQCYGNCLFASVENTAQASPCKIRWVPVIETVARYFSEAITRQCDRTESSLPAGAEVAIMQPMATAPLRHAPSPAVSSEALPADLLLVDVLKVSSGARSFHGCHFCLTLLC